MQDSGYARAGKFVEAFELPQCPGFIAAEGMS